MRRAIGAIAVLLVAPLVVMAHASASQLPLTGSDRPFATSLARCADTVTGTTPPTSGTSTSVQVSGILAACAGAALSVTVYDPATWAVSSGAATVPTTAGPVTVPVSPGYAPSASAAVSVTIDTWPIPATWTYVAPSTTVGCAVINPAGNVVNGKACSLAFGANTDGSGTSWNVRVTVTTTETGPVTWRATVGLADLTRFPFRARYVGEYTGGVVVGPVGSGFCSGTGRVVTFTGNAGYGWDTVSAGSSRTFDLVGSNAGAVANPVYTCP